MTRTNLGILFGLGLAALMASRFEGAQAAGVLGGYLLGACVALLSALWQRHCLRLDSARGLRAGLEAFLLKLAVALIATLTLRYVAPAGAALEWQAFLVAYAGAVLLVMFCATFETARALKESVL